MMGLILPATRRWRLPFGSVTMILTVSAALTVSVHEDFQLVIVAILTGLTAVTLARNLEPNRGAVPSFRLFALIVPIAFCVLYFVTLAVSGGIWWSIHMWAGAIVMAGTAGWLIRYAFVPPDPAAW